MHGVTMKMVRKIKKKMQLWIIKIILTDFIIKSNVLLEALKLARGTFELGNRTLIFATLRRQTWRRKVSGF
jgi:hypothetical protein